MTGANTHAFVPVSDEIVKGSHLEFSEVVRELTLKLPSDQFVYQRLDQNGHEIPLEKLQEWERKSEKYYACQNLVIRSFQDGTLSAYACHLLNGRYFRIPTDYWLDPVLNMPTDSIIRLTLPTSTQGIQSFVGSPFFVLTSDIKCFLQKTAKIPKRKQYEWDVEGCWHNHIRKLFAEYGNVGLDNPGWKRLADIERATIDYFQKTDGRILPQSTARRYAKKYHRQYLDQFTEPSEPI